MTTDKRMTLEQLGWRGGMAFTRTKGKVKLSDKAPVSRGRWVELVRFNDKEIVVWIDPAERFLNWSHVVEFKFTADEMRTISATLEERTAV